MRPSGSAGLALALAALVFAGPATPASRGVTFRVNSTLDQADNEPGDGICDASTGKPVPSRVRLCTLRAAIQETNALGGTNTIVLGAATYTRTLSGAGEEAAAAGDLDVTDSLTISGAGASSTVIDGGVSAKLTLVFVRRLIAAKSLRLSAGRRAVLLVARRRTCAGRYVFTARLVDSGGRIYNVNVPLRLQ